MLLLYKRFGTTDEEQSRSCVYDGLIFPLKPKQMSQNISVQCQSRHFKIHVVNLQIG